MTPSNPPKCFLGLTQWDLVPLGKTLIYNTNKMETFRWGLYIYLQQLTKNCPGIYPRGLCAHWANAYLEHQQKEQSYERFIYQSPVTNSRNWLESNQYIDDDKWNHKNRHPCHDLTQTCRGRKSICLVWINPTKTFLTHLRKSFRIN